MTPPPDPYKTLQVDSEAETEVIAAAYRRLARKYHPDLAAGDEAPTRMAAINAAWEVIGDPARRAAFDRGREIEAALTRRSAESTGSTAPATQSRTDTTLRQSTPNGSAHEPEAVSRDWTSGRSSVGGGYDPSMRAPDGEGAAGPPPGNPSGSRLNFGRYVGWSLGEIARADLEYIEWLDRTPIGRPYRDEIDVILRHTGRRRSTDAESTDRRGLFRRR